MSTREITVWLGDLLDYVLALAEHWRAFLTGSIATAVVFMLFGVVPDFKLAPLKFTVIFVFFGLLAAAFAAWREERKRSTQAEAEASALRREEAARKAEIVVGFPAEGDPVSSTEIAPHWELAQSKISFPVPLTMHTLNRGTRTVRHLLVNFLFPKDLDTRTPAIVPRGQQVSRDPDGTIRLIGMAENMHPGVGHQAAILLLVPNDLPEFDVEGTVSVDDTERQVFRLKVNVKGAVEARR
jgi:hypothetical protein